MTRLLFGSARVFTSTLQSPRAKLFFMDPDRRNRAWLPHLVHGFKCRFARPGVFLFSLRRRHQPPPLALLHVLVIFRGARARRCIRRHTACPNGNRVAHAGRELLVDAAATAQPDRGKRDGEQGCDLAAANGHLFCVAIFEGGFAATAARDDPQRVVRSSMIPPYLGSKTSGAFGAGDEKFAPVG